MRFNFSTLAVIVGLALAGWAGYQYWDTNLRVGLPEVPEVDFSNALPHVQAQIKQAYAGLRSSPRDADASVELGAYLHAYNHYDAAVIAYQRAITLQPKDFRWHYLLATVESLRGNEPEAIAALDRALAIDSENYPAAHLNIAELLFNAGDYARSEESFKEILDDPSLGIWANYGYGRLLVERGDEQAALAQLQQAVEREPYFGSAHYELALVYRRLGDSAASEKHLAMYQERKEKHIPRVDQLLFRINELNDNPASRVKKGAALASQGKHEESLAEFKKALEYDPAHGGAHTWLIRQYGRLGQLDLAETHYQKALEGNPDWPEAHIHYGTTLLAAGRHAGAIEVLSLAVTGNPYSAFAFLQRGVAHEGVGNRSAAIADYRQVLELEPDTRQAHALLGRQLASAGQADEAIVHLSQAILVLDERTPALEAALATLYMVKRDKTRALTHYKQALAGATQFGQDKIANAVRPKIQQLQQGDGT